MSPGTASALVAFLLVPASVSAQSFSEIDRQSTAGEGLLVSYRIEERDHWLRSGDWVPAAADLLVRYDAGDDGARAYRLEVYAVQDGKRVFVEVAGIQEYEKATRKWVHTSLDPVQAHDGRWIWGGTFRPGDEIVLQWRDSDSGAVLPHPVTLRYVEDYGGRLSFSTPVSVVFPMTGEPTATASAGFALRYYRTSNARTWRFLDRVGFPSIGFAYATVGGEKSVLYGVGFSILDDQVHLYYGGYRNRAQTNNFWMFGLSLKTKDLMSAVGRAIK